MFGCHFHTGVELLPRCLPWQDTFGGFVSAFLNSFLILLVASTLDLANSQLGQGCLFYTKSWTGCLKFDASMHTLSESSWVGCSRVLCFYKLCSSAVSHCSMAMVIVCTSALSDYNCSFSISLGGVPGCCARTLFFFRSFCSFAYASFFSSLKPAILFSNAVHVSLSLSQSSHSTKTATEHILWTKQVNCRGVQAET